MKFPSLKYLATNIIASFARFYISLLFAFTGTAAAIFLIHTESVTAVRVILSCVLGLSLSLGCTLYAERRGTGIMRWLPLISIPLTVAYGYWLTPFHDFENTRKWLIFLVLAVATHLWVATSAYIARNEKTGFWQFNEALYARMILSALFSGALYAGLAVAMLACSKLLGWNIRDKAYLHLFAVIAGIFNTWFFLAGVPADYIAINAEKLFPKALKIFTQYILMPIVTLYMVILYVYAAKITINWSLPKGWVSMLILGYSVVGILAVLLTNPLRDSKDNAWVRLFSRFFFRASLPLIALLYVAIYTRLRTYGITEPRYYLLLLGAWLGAIAVYFIVSQKKNIKVIPLSLIVIALLSLFGPWSAFSVSSTSQVHRIEQLLIKNKIWSPGAPVAHPVVTLNDADVAELRDMIDYFLERHELGRIQKFFPTDIEKKAQAKYKKNPDDEFSSNWSERDELKTEFMAMLCTNPSYFTEAAPPPISYRADSKYAINTKGYTAIYEYYTYSPNEKKTIMLSATEGADVMIIEDKKQLFIQITKVTIVNDGQSQTTQTTKDIPTETIDLTSIVKTLRTKKTDDIKPGELYADGTLKTRFILNNIDMMNETDTTSNGKLLLSIGGYFLFP